jgi:CubicO group peptidase (beta-lactamase class C family)
MKMQLTTLLVTAVLAMVALPAAGQQPEANLFDSRLQAEQWLRENHVPALGIGILRDGQLKEIRMFGELKPGSPAPYNAIFNVASLTKPIVALLTLKLVSSGAWKLDEPLARYWVDPDIASDPRHQKLTTRLVLSHQTGFKNWRYMNQGGKLSFDADPGTRFGYSGEGFEYLRKALEHKFHKTLAQLSDSLLFRPLGMHDTQYAWDRSTNEARFAHWFDTSGREHPRDYKLTVPNAADDLLTTIEDYGKFAAHVLQGGGLDSSVFRQMVRPQVPTKNGLFMSLGWEMFQNLGPKKEYALVHSGSDAGVQTLVILLPVSGQGLVIFTNGDNGNKLYEKLVIELLDTGKEMMAQVK